jgi:hypothetical protein
VGQLPDGKVVGGIAVFAHRMNRRAIRKPMPPHVTA